MNAVIVMCSPAICSTIWLQNSYACKARKIDCIVSAAGATATFWNSSTRKNFTAL